jgi:hypothetical protein
MTKPHEPNRVLLVLGLLDDLVHISAFAVDPLQHLDHFLVGSAVERAPQRADTCRDAGVQVGRSAADQPHGGGAAVLIVIGVQDEQLVHRPDKDRVDLVVRHRRREHHVQEVRAVAQLVAGIHEWLADRLLVGKGGNRPQLGEQARGCDVQLLGLGLLQLGVEARERHHHGRQHGHRMRALRITRKERPHVLVDHRVPVQQGREFLQFNPRRQPAVDQEVSNLDKRAAVSQVLDGISPVKQATDLAVHVTHGALA